MQQESAAPRPTPAPQLVQRRKAEPLGILDDHGCGVGNVHPHLDDGGGDQHIQLPGLELLHDLVLLMGFILPWSRPIRRWGSMAQATSV